MKSLLPARLWFIIIVSLISLSGSLILSFVQAEEPNKPEPYQPPPPVSPKPDKPLLLSEEVESLKKILVKSRNLEFKQDIKVGVKTREELKRRMLDDFNEEKPDIELDKIKKALIKFGLLPPDLELGKFMIDLLTEQIGGYYDPENKELNLITEVSADKVPAEVRQLEMVFGISWTQIATIHELTHALQDQHFDLLTLPMNDPDNDDLATAVKSVTEGEATYTMYAYPLSRLGLDMALMPDITQGIETMSFGGSGLMDQAPLYIKEGLLFPYIAGLYFIRRVKAHGGWAAVNKLYDDLPASTEQIIHPQKYINEERDLPTTITLPDLTSIITTTQWLHLLTNVMGELNVRIIFKEFLPNLRPKRIAAGWDGDQFAVFEYLSSTEEGTSSESDQPSGTFPLPEMPFPPLIILVWYTIWDSDKDTDQFFQGYQQVIEKKYPSVEVKESNDTKVVWQDTKNLIYIEKRRQDVLIIETVPEEFLDPLLSLIWNQTDKTELTKVARVKPKEKPEDDERKEDK